MLYELITVTCPLLGLARASEGVRTWTSEPEARGELLGCWRADIGALGRAYWPYVAFRHSMT